MSIFKRKQKTTEIELGKHLKAFELKRKLWDSSAEEKVYRILRYYIHESYIIIPHVPFLEVFPIKDDVDYQVKEQLRSKVTSYHFDFVVFDAWFHPVLIMELNGGMHQQKDYKKKIDSFKKRVLEEVCADGKEKIKLIFVDELCKSKTDDELIEIIRDKLKAEMRDRVNCPAYCIYCGSLLHYQKGEGGWYYECKQTDCAAPRNKRIKKEWFIHPLLKEFTKEQELTAEKLKQLIRNPNGKDGSVLPKA